MASFGLGGLMKLNASVLRAGAARWFPPLFFAAVALFHRPIEEIPLAAGRRFHRAWLRMPTLVLSAAPMAVLADNDTAAAIVRRGFGIPPQRKLMTARRMGVVPQPPAGPQARLSVAALIA